MKEVVFLVEPDQDGGFRAHCPEEGILTQGDTLDELHEMIAQALAYQYAPATPPASVTLRFHPDSGLMAYTPEP